MLRIFYIVFYSILLTYVQRIKGTLKTNYWEFDVELGILTVGLAVSALAFNDVKEIFTNNWAFIMSLSIPILAEIYWIRSKKKKVISKKM